MLYDKFYTNMLYRLEADITEFCEEIREDEERTFEEWELADIILGMIKSAKEKMNEDLENYTQRLNRKHE